MRLSSRLSDKSKNNGEIESFIDWEKYTTDEGEETEDIHFITSGDFIEIQIGTITLPFYSNLCKDTNSFISPKKLHCLIINKDMFSIDCQLKCMDYDKNNPICKKCNPCVQAWFLVGIDDIRNMNPIVNVIKQSFKLSKEIKLPIEMEDTISEWLGKAEIAYKERLGAGAIIYLRSAYEQITFEVGRKAGVNIYKSNGKSRPFEQVIRAVDNECSIIPVIYSQNRYELFRKLSEIAHGKVDEEKALKAYEPLRSLVVGIIENVRKKDEEIKKNSEIKKALQQIGFNNGGDDDE